MLAPFSIVERELTFIPILLFWAFLSEVTEGIAVSALWNSLIGAICSLVTLFTAIVADLLGFVGTIGSCDMSVFGGDSSLA